MGRTKGLEMIQEAIGIYGDPNRKDAVKKLSRRRKKDRKISKLRSQRTRRVKEQKTWNRERQMPCLLVIGSRSFHRGLIMMHLLQSHPHPTQDGREHPSMTVVSKLRVQLAAFSSYPPTTSLFYQDRPGHLVFGRWSENGEALV